MEFIPITIKMFKEMFLQANLTSHIFSVIRFIIVPTMSKTVCGPTNIMRKTGLTCQKICQGFVIAVKAMVNFI